MATVNITGNISNYLFIDLGNYFCLNSLINIVPVKNDRFIYIR